MVARATGSKQRGHALDLALRKVAGLFDINHSKILFNPIPRVMEIKTKINKWDIIKLKRFCTAKETIHMMKRQPSEWEKIIAN